MGDTWNDADMEYDPSDVEIAEWLASKFYNHKTMDQYTKNALWIYWTRGDDEIELTDEEFFDPDNENLIDKDEVAEIFRIETDIFDFETPICKAFDEFNYLLKIDTDLLTSDILGFKTYDEWMDEWNKGIPWVPKEPWSENRIPIDDIHHIYEPIRFKNGKAKWPTCNSNNEGFCNGGELPGMIQVGYMTYFQYYKWYDDLVDGKLKEEALSKKPSTKDHEEITFNHDTGRNDEEDIHEEREPNNDHGIDNLDNDLVRDNTSYHTSKEEE
ncbi:VIER F-box protein 2 [Tanacetum coccineum]